MKLLIDADSIIWRAGCVKEANEDSKHGLVCALSNTKLLMNKIINRFPDDEYSVYIGGVDKSNFRYTIYPEYKANRINAPKPVQFDPIRNYLMKYYGAQEVNGEETDDRVSVLQCQMNQSWDPESIPNTMIVSIDKDLNNTPGMHYNYVKDEQYFVDEIQALRNFYLQILTGDRADNVPRVKKGWKQKEAEESIITATTEKELLDIVYKEVYNVLNDNRQAIEFIHRNGRLLWMRREENQLWEIPIF